MDTPPPAKTVVLVVTLDGDALIVNPGLPTSPRVLRRADAWEHLCEIVNDPQVKHSVPNASYGIGDAMRDLVRMVGAPDAPRKDGE